MSGGEWYGGGLRFQCTQCGNCCSGPEGYVAFSDAEAEAMAAHFGLSVPEFESRYVHRVRGIRSLKERKTEHGRDCIFLDRETEPGKALCSIYEVRPQQCRTWPFWPENLRSEAAWARAARGCPGMNEGTLVPVELIRIIRDSIPPDPL